jgi:hypothetical protein
MAGHLQRLLTLFALVASTSTAFAQSGRPWVDPPTQDGARPETSPPATAPDAAPTSTVDPKPAAAFPRQAPVAADEQGRKSNGNIQRQVPSGDASAKPVIRNEVAQEAVTERGARTKSRKAIALPKAPARNTTLSSRRGPSTRDGSTVTRRESRSAAGPRSTRFGRAQGMPGPRLEVMNLRTIQFPDGRRVTILTKPNPDAIPELTRPPGY